jgi:hypothetical protein
MSGRSAIAFSTALAGGQEEQPWLWYNSTTVGLAGIGGKGRRRPKQGQGCKGEQGFVRHRVSIQAGRNAARLARTDAAITISTAAT